VRDGLLPRLPAFNDDANWNRLVDFRDGLVHANSSRPLVPGGGGPKPPMPSKDDVEALTPGWALGIVVARIRKLHEAAGTAAPDWLVI
jgi:hypothetical protein